MKRILVSQRLEVLRDNADLRIDPNWFKFIDRLGACCHPVGWYDGYQVPLFSTDVCGVILTGGGDLSTLDRSVWARNRDTYEADLIKECMMRRVPILGVCRGMQLINHYQGGTLKKIIGHVATTHSVEVSSASGMECFASGLVNSYHDFGIEAVGQGMTVLATSLDGSVEAIACSTKSVLGIMWHPEREQTYIESRINFFKSFFGL